MDWTIATQLVTTMKAGLDILMEPPISYMLVFGFIMAGLSFAASKVVGRKRG